MAKLDFGSTVSLDEGVQLICTAGQVVWVHLEGEPGIGKSAMLQMIVKQLNTAAGGKEEYMPVYLDVGQMDLGDLTMPKVLEENNAWVTRYAPNARFGIQHGKKLVMMADEFTKGSKPVVTMLLPCGLERRLGDIPLPEGSIFFSTGNLSSDGLGDVLQGHGRSRISTVRVRKPQCWAHDSQTGAASLTEWGLWAANNNVPPVLLAWCRENPSAFATYTDSAEQDNPFIYNPKHQQKAYVCARSLTKAGHIIKARAALTDNAFTCALVGTVGEAAARSMQSYFALADKLPSTESILKSPKTAGIPDSGAGMCIVTLNLLQVAARTNMDSIMEYVQRLKKESTALFAISIMKSDKKSVAANNPKFTKWALDNNYVFG